MQSSQDIFESTKRRSCQSLDSYACLNVLSWRFMLFESMTGPQHALPLPACCRWLVPPLLRAARTFHLVSAKKQGNMITSQPLPHRMKPSHALASHISCIILVLGEWGAWQGLWLWPCIGGERVWGGVRFVLSACTRAALKVNAALVCCVSLVWVKR